MREVPFRILRPNLLWALRPRTSTAPAPSPSAAAPKSVVPALSEACRGRRGEIRNGRRPTRPVDPVVPVPQHPMLCSLRIHRPAVGQQPPLVFWERALFETPVENHPCFGGFRKPEFPETPAPGSATHRAHRKKPKVELAMEEVPDGAAAAAENAAPEGWRCANALCQAQ